MGRRVELPFSPRGRTARFQKGRPLAKKTMRKQPEYAYAGAMADITIKKHGG